jgi:hypothetical protein
MKFLKLIIFTLSITFVALHGNGQANPFINVLPANSGIVSVGATLDITVTVGNAGPISTIAQAKLRPIIQVPPSVTFLSTAQQTGLPAGWSILSNTGSQLRICNSTDPIPVNTSRTITLKVQGVTVTAPQTFSGNINFGNGTTCAAGTSVTGDITTDNSALSTIEVIPGVPLPLMLNNFTVNTDNCIAYLHWSTSSEVNTEKFDIEKSETTDAKWKTIGSVYAHSNPSLNSTYYFTDDNISSANKEVMYRLKMVDIDGSFMYSPTVDAVLKCDEQNLYVFPNPVANGKFQVSLTSIENVDASLTSVTGQHIKNVILKSGINNVDVSALSNGVYFLNVKFSNGINQTVKVNIQK